MAQKVPCDRLLPFCFSPPHSLCSFFLAIVPKCQAGCYLRAFARADSPAWGTLLTDLCMAHSLTVLRALPECHLCRKAFLDHLCYSLPYLHLLYTYAALFFFIEMPISSYLKFYYTVMYLLVYYKLPLSLSPNMSSQGQGSSSV